MSYIIVLFNLKSEDKREAYEAWAASTDIPTVRGLPSINGFDVFKLTTARNSDQASPYQYVEIIDVSNFDQFGADVATDRMKQISSEFREFADAPLFINSVKIGD